MKNFFKKILARKKQIGIILLLALIIIQFIRPERNTGMAANMNDITHYTKLPPEVKTILETSCYDCHSDHTNYPWYTNI
ncbi:MAG TPA: heme-binding domain-containing protein, partial [Bacteroidia bacterium]|nr:heme-binding domain-containing protein [Bacteroidia bacterium]